ncbi:aminoacyl-histidine dipeptidase [bacterium]|nr:aminoacyl-histidine dipeptidase [bacterium]
MTSPLQNLTPAPVWRIFEDLTRIPRPSKHEERVLAHLKAVAGKAGLAVTQDKTGNLIVRVPASPGCENAPAVVLQAHVDMVCEKNADVDFDFDKDAIRLRRDGDWIKATGTTLGADNGIGVAAAMAVALAGDVRHGPLEVLLTVDEETGLTGAANLDPDIVTGRILINLDSEETNILYIGCAGGGGVKTAIPAPLVDAPGGAAGYRLRISGLRGGHSGCDIHENRGNAVRLLARAIKALDPLGARLADFHSGDKHNAIPREGVAVLALDADIEDKARAVVGACLAAFRAEHPEEKNLALALQPTERPNGVLAPDAQAAAVNALIAFPNGVLAMSRELPGLVETSNSLAAARLAGGEIVAHNSPRSSNDAALAEAIARICAVGELAGAKNDVQDAYPGWQPRADAPIVRLVENAHEALFGNAPRITAIHAGLECGIIGKNFPEMDMVSFGPDIVHPHSPDEAVNIASVEKFWRLLVDVLERVGKGEYASHAG